jgi:hypothetical protein
MTGYSKTPLWKKLGYREKLPAYVEGASSNYFAALDLPPEFAVRWARRPNKGISFIHLFTKSKRRLRSRLPAFRKVIAEDGIIWVSWPKKSSGIVTDLTEDVVREVALPLGLVDIKVCAVDEVWSGLKLVIRRELRRSKTANRS